MIHPLLQTILLTVLVPAAVAGLFAFVAAGLPPGRWRSGMLAFGLALAWCVGWWLTVRAPRWPAVEAADWQFFAVAITGLWAFLSPLQEAPRPWRWLAGFAFFAVLFGLLLQRVLTGLWPDLGALVWPLGLAALALVNIGAMARVGHSVQAAWTFFALMVFSVSASALLVLSGAASFGHGLGLMAAACGSIWLVSWCLRRQVDLAPVALVAVTIAGGLLVQGLFFAGLKAWPALLVALAWPAAAGAVWLLRQGSGTFRASFAVAVVAALGGGALWLAR